VGAKNVSERRDKDKIDQWVVDIGELHSGSDLV
jgi:hypothetical protein